MFGAPAEDQIMEKLQTLAADSDEDPEGFETTTSSTTTTTTPRTDVGIGKEGR